MNIMGRYSQMMVSKIYNFWFSFCRFEPERHLEFLFYDEKFCNEMQENLTQGLYGYMAIWLYGLTDFRGKKTKN